MSSDYGIPAAPVKQATTSTRRYLQFSLRSLVVAMVIIAFIFGCVVATPLFAILACGLYVVSTAMVVATLIYGKGWIRGFAFGFAVPHVVGYIIALNTFNGPVEVLIQFVLANVASIVVGVGMAILHSFFRRRGGTLPVPNIPYLRDWLTNE